MSKEKSNKRVANIPVIISVDKMDSRCCSVCRLIECSTYHGYCKLPSLTDIKATQHDVLELVEGSIDEGSASWRRSNRCISLFGG